MKKTIALLLAMMMLISLCACGKTETPKVEPPAAAPAAANTASVETAAEEAASYTTADIEYFAQKITPLSEKVTLKVGVTPGVLHDFPTYLATQLGLTEMMNIDAVITSYGNGPLMVEAMAAGDVDCGGYGIGGLLAGSVQDVADILWIRANEGIIQKYFVKNDAPIAGFEIDPETGIRGTADDWRGLEVYCAPGTTLQFTLGKGLEKLGLSFDDLNMVYMDPQNIPTALHAGQGDAWGLWNMYGFTESVLSGYTEAFSCASIGSTLLAGSVASRAALADAGMKQAIFTWLECVMAATNWMTASDENMQLASEYYAEWCDFEGISTGGTNLYEYMKNLHLYTLEEEYEMFTTESENGNLLAEEGIIDPMEFFISKGNYTEDDIEKILDGNVNPEFVIAMSEKYK